MKEKTLNKSYLNVEMELFYVKLYLKILMNHNKMNIKQQSFIKINLSLTYLIFRKKMKNSMTKIT